MAARDEVRAVTLLAGGAECLTNDVGEVCALSSDGVIVASSGAETAFAFMISAMDAEGQPFDGELIVIP
jgi:hypothetical protein